MGYPTSLITDTTPGVDLYPPQPGQSFGSNTQPPSGLANPDHPTWLKRISDEVVAIEAKLGLPASPASGTILATLAGKIGPGPNDGNTYLQQNGGWVAKLILPEAPTDGQQYSRKSQGWQPFTPGVPEAPNDGQQYARKSQAWATITGGGGGSSQAISRVITAGDSYGANTAYQLGLYRVSNGPTYAELIAIALGLNSQGRYPIIGAYNSASAYLTGSVVTYNGLSWMCIQITLGGNTPAVGSAFWAPWIVPGYAPGSVTAYNTSLGWDNYAVAGATWNVISGALTPNVIKGQLALFNTDFSNAVPGNALIFIQFTGINDTSQLIQFHGRGMPTADDPVLTGTIPSFVQPAVGGSVVVSFPSIPTGLAVGVQVWITGGGVYNVSVISGTSVTLVLQAAFWNTSPIAATGATVPGGNMRWAAAQAMDDIMADYLASVTGLFTNGATKIIISNCPNYWLTPFGQTTSGLTQANVTNTVNYWNAKLSATFAALMAAGKVWMHDLATIFANVIANPQQYNLANLDAQNLPGQFDDSNWLYDGLIHPAAGTHRVYGKDVAQLIVSIYPASPQLTAFASVFNIEPNCNPINWQSGIFAYSIPQTPSPLPFPPAATSNDPRLLLAQTISQPQLMQWIGTDYTEGLLLPNSNWSSWINGGGSGINSGTSAYALGGHGGVQGALAAVNDGYGQTYGLPFILMGGPTWLKTGPIGMVARVGRFATAGDQVTWRMGFVDALLLARPANGIFLELTDNGAGVFTLSLILAASSTYTVVATASYTNQITNALPQTFMFISDYSLRWWSVFVSGVCVLTIKMPALPYGLTLFLAWQAIKTALTGAGATYAFTDGIWGLNTNQARM